MTTAQQPLAQLVLAELMQNPTAYDTLCQTLGISRQTFNRLKPQVRVLAEQAGYALRRPTKWDGNRYRAVNFWGTSLDTGIHSGLNVTVKDLFTRNQSALRDTRIAHDFMVNHGLTTTPEYAIVQGLMGTFMQMNMALTGALAVL